MFVPELQSEWSRLALELPTFHASLVAGDSSKFRSRLALLPDVRDTDVALLPSESANLLGLDVFMVDAVIRRHRLTLAPGLAPRLAAANVALAERLGCAPILSYPFYIRLNPTDLRATRRFTPFEAEFRFIRMHRLIEDAFDALIETVGGVLDAADRPSALATALPAIGDALRLANRVVGGFRDPVRMPQRVFHEEFRPYFGPQLDAAGQVLLEGPSGLQSPTFRAVCMLMGYRDALLDGWTERIGRYHPPATRRWLAGLQSGRDMGRSLASVADAVLGTAPDLPHIHPEYGAHIPDLVALARRFGYVTADVLEVLSRHGVVLGAWPTGAPNMGPLPALQNPPHLAPERWADLQRLAQLEAMLLGFHLEHVATTAVQIGYERGTGGTSGVDFLLLATFRRAFPRLWESGLGRKVAAVVA